MQSVQETLEKQIEQLFVQLVSIWKESDTRKIEAVKMLAARMEELYLQLGWQINTISADIARKLEAAGITKTAHHVHDFLDSKYKREKAPAYNLSEGYQNTNNGVIDGNNLLDLMHKINGNIEQITSQEAYVFHEAYLKLEAAAKANKQWCETKGWSLPDDDPLRKRYAKVTTDMPEPKETDAFIVWQKEVTPIVKTFAKVHEEIETKLFRLPPEERKIPEMVEAMQEYSYLLKNVFEPINDFLAPLKDLKFAMAKPRWWKSVVKYFDHGKHAAAVMDAIDSHKYLEERLIDVLKVNCPHEGCPYFATVTETTVTPMDAPARPQIKLLIDHMIDNHPKEARYSSIRVERTKIPVQVPKTRDMTREEIGDKIKELVELAIKFVPAIKAFKVLSEWREETASDRVATRRIEAHVKLHDLA